MAVKQEEIKIPFGRDRVRGWGVVVFVYNVEPLCLDEISQFTFSLIGTWLLG
jgi:hypothetical protein